MRSARNAQGGVTLVVVVVVLSVLMLGGMALARMAQTGVLSAGNLAYKDGSRAASEIGVNAAYQRLQELADDNADAGAWYIRSMRPAQADGTPSGVDWSGLPSTEAGGYRIRYVVERLCDTDVVTDPSRHCLLTPARTLQSAKAGAEALEAPGAKQFRVTVRADGPRRTTTTVQALVTPGT